MIENKKHKKENALLIGVQLSNSKQWEVQDHINELSQLTISAGADIHDHIIIRQSKINAGHYIGTGKAKELYEISKEHNVTMIIFDDDLSPVQGRNLELITKVRILDRTQLILDIFSQRAQTKEGSLQVRLAQHEYLLPRLRRMWTHLERQKGGIGLRGPGETQLEMDRRSIQNLIRTLKRDLELVRLRRSEQRRGRRRHGWPLISLVGYTNAGKSTLLNNLSGASIHAQNKLFATLDPTTRVVEIPNYESILMTDTVGFIQKLPTHLIKSFRATLEEVSEADIILHIIDASNPQVEMQINAVNTILDKIGVTNKKVIHVFNKADKLNISSLRKKIFHRFQDVVIISAKKGEGFNSLFKVIKKILKDNKQELKLSIPLSEGKLLSTLKNHAVILNEKYKDSNAELLVRVSPSLASSCKEFRV